MKLRTVLLLGAIALSIACAGAPPRQDVASPPAPVPSAGVRFTILQINDVYKIEGLLGGRLGGLARVRTLRKRLEAEGRPVLVLHAGDLLFPSVMDNWTKTQSKVLHGEEYFPKLDSAGPSQAQVFKSSPREGSESVRLMYLLSIASARKRLLIANSYFVPDDLSVKTIADARKRGVDVEVIVPGTKIDSELSRKASRSRWGDLLEAGVEIYEYQPTMISGPIPSPKATVMGVFWVMRTSERACIILDFGRVVRPRAPRYNFGWHRHHVIHPSR